MTTFLNLGPARSGTRSLYGLFSDHPQILTGPIKESLLDGYSLNRFDEYMNHKLENNTKDYKVLFEGSPRILYKYNSEQLKKAFEGYDFKFIFIIRDPIKFYTTRLYRNYFFKEICNFQKNSVLPTWDRPNIDYRMPRSIKIDEEIDLKELSEHLDLNRLEEFKNDWRDMIACSRYEFLKWVLKVFKKEEIFTLCLEDFEDSRKDLFKFIGVDNMEGKLPHYGKSMFKEFRTWKRHEEKMMLLKLYVLIHNKVKDTASFVEFMKNDLLKIDNTLGTNTYERYY